MVQDNARSNRRLPYSQHMFPHSTTISPTVDQANPIVLTLQFFEIGKLALLIKSFRPKAPSRGSMIESLMDGLPAPLGTGLLLLSLQHVSFDREILIASYWLIFQVHIDAWRLSVTPSLSAHGVHLRQHRWMTLWPNGILYSNHLLFLLGFRVITLPPR